ncbi:MAG: alpha/beta fold hydrolase [Planctomycetales bacterium]|nr:alpha/beta fold hydrolase [Planctomycetales bacterium]
MTEIADEPAIWNLEGDSVVLIHGYGGHRWLMLPLAGRLRSAGLTVHNWGYHSLFLNVERHAAAFASRLATLEADASVRRFHVVTHSMGAVVTRAALLSADYAKLGRIVMLCPPNRGSHMASRFAPWFGWFSQTLSDITDLPDSFVNRLPDDLGNRYPLGIIAAKSDYIVDPHSTHLPHERDHVTISGMHSGVLFGQQAARAAVRFMQQATFSK